jgi:Spy/CpxP family protein refolding chaperone
MKRGWTALMMAATVTALVGFGQLAMAEMGQGKMGGPGAGPKGPPPIAERLQRMGQHLQLTDEQKTKIKPFLEDEMAQAKTIHEDSSLSRPQKMEKLQQLRSSTQAKIKPILTPEQQKKLEEMQEKAKERRESRKQKHQAPPQPEPAKQY